jgi:hypothetical protein
MITKEQIIVLPLTVSTYRARQEAVKATWAKDLTVHWLNKENGFPNIPIDFIDYITKEISLKYRWYIFCDDDTHLFTGRAMAMLEKYDSDKPYCIGSIITLAIDPSCRYPSGVCFMISHSGMLKLKAFLANKSATNLPRHFNHDSSMGLWCSMNNIELVNVEGMYGTHPWNLGHSDEVIGRALAYNHIGPEDQSRLLPHH